jgi:hypothetical protein
LIGGGRDLARVHVEVEGLVDGEWFALARLGSAAAQEVLAARIVDLGPEAAEQIRVRIVDASRELWGHILVDALTFIDVPEGE